MLDRKENWIEDARNLLIESVLREITSADSFEDLKTQLHCATAKFGLLYNSRTKKEVKERFLNVAPHEQNFQEFKKALLSQFNEFLTNNIK